GVARGELAARRRAALRALAEALATTAATAAEHLHLVGDDLGDVALLPVLAGELVVADAALDVALRALAQVLAGDLAELAEQLHPVPLGALLGVAVAVLAHAGGGQADRGHRHSGLGVLDLGIVAEVADEDDLVDAARHSPVSVWWSPADPGQQDSSIDARNRPAPESAPRGRCFPSRDRDGQGPCPYNSGTLPGPHNGRRFPHPHPRSAAPDPGAGGGRHGRGRRADPPPPGLGR